MAWKTGRAETSRFDYQIQGFLGGALIGFTQTGVASTTIDGLATLTGRLGLAQDRWLVYVKGGAAWAHIEHDVSAFGVFHGG